MEGGKRQPLCLIYFDLFVSPLLCWFINQLEYLLECLCQTVNTADCLRAQTGNRPASALALPQPQLDSMTSDLRRVTWSPWALVSWPVKSCRKIRMSIHRPWLNGLWPSNRVEYYRAFRCMPDLCVKISRITKHFQGKRNLQYGGLCTHQKVIWIIKTQGQIVMTDLKGNLAFRGGRLRGKLSNVSFYVFIFFNHTLPVINIMEFCGR